MIKRDVVEYISSAKMLRFVTFVCNLSGSAAFRSGHLAVHLLVDFDLHLLFIARWWRWRMYRYYVRSEWDWSEIVGIRWLDKKTKLHVLYVSRTFLWFLWKMGHTAATLIN